MNFRKILCGGSFVTLCGQHRRKKIDRKAVVLRNNPSVQTIDTLAYVHGRQRRFRFHGRRNGTQTFADLYKRGMALGTQSHWG